MKNTLFVLLVLPAICFGQKREDFVKDPGADTLAVNGIYLVADTAGGTGYNYQLLRVDSNNVIHLGNGAIKFLDLRGYLVLWNSTGTEKIDNAVLITDADGVVGEAVDGKAQWSYLTTDDEGHPIWRDTIRAATKADTAGVAFRAYRDSSGQTIANKNWTNTQGFLKDGFNITSAYVTDLEAENFIVNTASTWGVMYANGSSNLVSTGWGTAGKVLTANGVSSAPTWGDSLRAAQKSDSAAVSGKAYRDSTGQSIYDATQRKGDTLLVYAGSWGRNTAVDTAYFRPTYYYPSMYVDGSDTIVVTKIIGVAQGSSPSVALKMQFDVNDHDGTPTSLNTSALTVTSTTAGNSTTTINNPKIPPGVWLWPELTAVTTQPQYLSINVFGYRIRKKVF